jgi:L-asparaginase
MQSDSIRRVLVLGTGGTIAGSGGPAGSNVGYTAGTVAVGALLAGVDVPEGIALEAEQVAQLDSKDMDFATWRMLAQRCAHWLAQPDVAGVVVTHGTDTIEETAYFLQSVIEAPKPIVLTCAMRPATAHAPDGPQNLKDALAVAAQAGATGVVVVCAGGIHDPRHVRKDHPYRLDAFGSGDAGLIGFVEEGQVRLEKPWPNPDIQPGLLGTLGEPEDWPRVEIVLSHAGASGRLIDGLVGERHRGEPGAIDGIVLASTGNGTLHHTIEGAAQRAMAAGVAVLRATRCAEGRILGQAEGSLPHAGDLSPVKARIALMLRIAAERARHAVSQAAQPATPRQGARS